MSTQYISSTGKPSIVLTLAVLACKGNIICISLNLF